LVTFSTLDLAKTNQRMQASLEEVMILSDQVLAEVMDAIRLDIASLFHVCEAIAMLDMLCRCVRPLFAQF
jgi:DNA mismatch repair protein MSH4